MGRRKVELKPIEDKSSRQVMFSKRRSGLIKKARELSILCDVEVALFVFSGRGRLYEFRTGDSLRRILDRYQNHKDADVAGRNVKESEKLCEGCEDLMKATNLLQMVQRLFEQHKVEQLDLTELIQLEHKLDAIQRQTRIRKSQLMMKSVMALHEKITATSATTTKTTADDHSRRLTHHHQLQLQDPIVNQELYAYANTNQSTGPVPPLQQQQESTSYYLP